LLSYSYGFLLVAEINIELDLLMLLSFFLSSILTDLSGLYYPGPGVLIEIAAAVEVVNLFSVDPNTPYFPQGFF
jgi:hypothetical protein